MLRCVYRRRTKRGVSTILGILLMVGILFTSVIPLFMYVNEVNNYYDRTVVDLKIEDQERSMEDLTVYAFGHDNTSTAIDVFLINTGPVSLNITRIWVMSRDLNKTLIFDSTNLTSLPLQLIASNQTTIEMLDLVSILMYPDPNGEKVDYFNIEVATNRGNKYSSQTNSLHKIQGGWETGTQNFQIQVIIVSDWGLSTYRIEVDGADNSTSGFYDRVESFQIHGEFFTVIPVPKVGSYLVTVSKQQGQQWNEIGNSTVVLTWAHPSALREFDDT